MKKKLFFMFVLFVLLIPRVHASSPAGFIYDGPDQVKQGEIVSYDLKIRDGNYFFTYSENKDDPWECEVEYDLHVFKFVSFFSTIDGISAINDSVLNKLTIKIESKAFGPYVEGQKIATLSFKILEHSPLGEITLYQPTGYETGTDNLNVYKKINVIKTEEITVSKDNNKDVKTYIVIGSLLLLNLSFITTIIILININKNKKNK